LVNLGYKNVHVRCGDGHEGWGEFAPYDAVIVTCAAERLPQALVKQLAEGGRLVIPIGPRWTYQLLWVMERRGEGIESCQLGKVAFVPFRRPSES
jgi:protein-L-isoaspartate(D-aspartate) O-methyltransferase